MEYNKLGLKIDDPVIIEKMLGTIVSMTPSGKYSVVAVAGKEKRVLTSSLTDIPEETAEKLVKVLEAQGKAAKHLAELEENAKKQTPKGKRIVMRMDPEYWKGNPKINRNDACPCGSGRKYKKCHALKDDAELTQWLKEHRYGTNGK